MVALFLRTSSRLARSVEEPGVARTRRCDEAVPQVKGGGALMAGNNLQLDTAPPESLRASVHISKQGRADACAAVFWDDVEFLEPPDHTTVFCAQMRGHVRNADSASIRSRQQHESMPLVRDNHSHHIAQRFFRRRDFMLEQLRLEQLNGRLDVVCRDCGD